MGDCGSTGLIFSKAFVFPGQSKSLPLLKTVIRQKRSLSARTALPFLLLGGRTFMETFHGD